MDQNLRQSTNVLGFARKQQSKGHGMMEQRIMMLKSSRMDLSNHRMNDERINSSKNGALINNRMLMIRGSNIRNKDNSRVHSEGQPERQHEQREGLFSTRRGTRCRTSHGKHWSMEYARESRPSREIKEHQLYLLQLL